MKFNKHQLTNGLRIITVPMADNPSVTVLVVVETGSKYETKNINGLSHFLEHMVFKGSTRRPKASDISRELDSIGAHYNAFTTQEFTGYYAKADRKHIDKIVDIVSDMYLNPIFDSKEIEKERGVIIEEIRMYEDLPQRQVVESLTALLYGDQPAGWSVLGPVDNIRKLTREDFLKYRADHYVASATTVVVSGSFDEKAIVANLEKVFGSISTSDKVSKPALIEKQNKPLIRTDFKETDQTHVAMGFRTFSIHDPRMPALSVLATMLGGSMSSRLFSKMRDDLGICYYVRATPDAATDSGVLAITAGLDNTRVNIGITEILRECKRLVDEPVSAAELTKVKDYIAGTSMLELETSDARAEYCAAQEVLRGKIESPEEYIAKIQKVSAADIQKLASQIFTNSTMAMAIIGRYKDPAAFEPIFHFGQ